ncbi:MAG: CoA pyrophosphatase [Acidimicrobiales bacterium]|nr:CoA pyrophosphatase [Acidimicrobiales bacterium]
MSDAVGRPGIAPAGRGGPQQVPRPPGTRAGGPPPWATLPEPAGLVTVDGVRRVFAALPPARRSPREGRVDRASAVLAALYEHAGQTWIVLTRRSGALRVHSGEVSFPGGGQDAGEDLRTTATREACEEVGLDPGSVEIVGELDHLSTITSNSFIVPFVAVLDGRPHLEPNPAEVDAVLHVPVAELLDPEVYREERWDIFGTERPMWFFELVGDTVWGATAAMLRQLLGLATGTLGRGDLGHV